MRSNPMMSVLSTFDPQAFVAATVTEAAPRLTKMLSKYAAGKIDRLKIILGVGFEHHVQATYQRCYRIKTLIYREKPVELLSQYVSVNLKSEDLIVDDNSLIDDIERYKSIIVTGSAGSGKTMLMKYLALSRFHNPKGRIPLFIEMRNIDFTESENLIDHIFTRSASASSDVTRDQFELGLREGLFLIILDGLDEVDPRHRDIVHKDIMEMPVNYPANLLVISSRWEERLSGWVQFTNFSVEPLELQQVEEVVSRIDFDPEIKERFQSALRNGLYDSYQSFLENPLLTTIMLLRYDQFANISAKVHIFYEQAFDTLFFKHDVSKGVYERRRYSNLSLDDFKRFFRRFVFLRTERTCILLIGRK